MITCFFLPHLIIQFQPNTSHKSLQQLHNTFIMADEYDFTTLFLTYPNPEHFVCENPEMKDMADVMMARHILAQLIKSRDFMRAQLLQFEEERDRIKNSNSWFWS